MIPYILFFFALTFTLQYLSLSLVKFTSQTNRYNGVLAIWAIVVPLIWTVFYYTINN